MLQNQTKRGKYTIYEIDRETPPPSPLHKKTLQIKLLFFSCQENKKCFVMEFQKAFFSTDDFIATDVVVFISYIHFFLITRPFESFLVKFEKAFFI